MQFWSDPLRIYYYLIMDDDDVEDTSLFQGLGLSWRYLNWAMGLIATLPGDINERVRRPEQIAVQRVAGLRPLMWRPMSISALKAIPVTDYPPCMVLLSGQPEVAARVEQWRAANGSNALHISSVDGCGISPDDFNLDILRDYCLARLHEADQLLVDGQRAIIAKSGGSWAWPQVIFENYDVKGHNITTPNHMALERLGFTLRESKPFIGHDEKSYTEAVIQSAVGVAAMRLEFADSEISALTAPSPGVILFEPAVYRTTYKAIAKRDADSAAIARAMRQLQTQKGLHTTADIGHLEFLYKSEIANVILSERAEELLSQTLAVGLVAAQTITPVLRLSPGVNHVFGSLSNYARNLRAKSFEAKRKAGKLFANIQDQLRGSIGDERIEFISRTRGPVKIISDAPIEWLPIGNLPLSFRRDCSRIPVTPGNLMMGELPPPEPMSIPPEALRKVLVISSFKNDDPLRNVMKVSLEANRPVWQAGMELTQVFVSTVEEFKAALNSFDGQILVFDGHGVANDETPVSKILIGDVALDVWSIRGEVRCPPIVILSACDTHGIDASSHATVGNGFIAIGARSVLGTFLPVDGQKSALFIARLLHRIAEYIPGAIHDFERSTNWNEVMSGMLRMSLATEIIMATVKPMGSPAYMRIQTQANHEINGGDRAWFDKLIDRIADALGITRDVAEKRIQQLVALSDAIRYTQLGNPGAIVISDETVLQKVLKAREQKLAEQLATGKSLDS